MRRSTTIRTAVLAGLAVVLVTVAPVATAPLATADVTSSRVVTVADADDDAEGDERVRRSAELERVRYVSRPGAERLIVRAHLARLVDGRRAATVRQHVGILISTSSSCHDSWIVSADNRGRSWMRYEQPCGAGSGRVEPDVLRVTTRPGEDGVLRVELSTELLDDRPVELRTVAQVGNGRAWDFTRFTRPLRLG